MMEKIGHTSEEHQSTIRKEVARLEAILLKIAAGDLEKTAQDIESFRKQLAILKQQLS